MKKLMILGGGPNQIPLIKAAKKNGYHVIVCDYNESAPGVELADELCLVSIMDREGALEAAKKKQVDGVISNSEPAMPVVAYVGNALGIPSNDYDTVAAMTNKYAFRTLLKEKGFAVPGFFAAASYEEAETAFRNLKKPVMIKPEASSGSRGVKKLTELSELKTAFDEALAFSRTDRVILEEYINNSCGYIVGGDIFVSDQKVVFWGLMSCLRDQEYAPLVPTGNLFPAKLTQAQLRSIEAELSKAAKALSIWFSTINVEMMIDPEGTVYIIELNPRNGGNYIPNVLLSATGFDIFDATVRNAVGESVKCWDGTKCEPYMTYMVHTNQIGTLREVQFSEEIRPFIESYLPDLNPGDRVEPFANADKRIGALILHFLSTEQRDAFAKNIGSHVLVKLE